MAAAAAAFARTPALLNEDDLIDYGTSEGIAIYKEGSKSLLSDKKSKLELSTIDKKKLINKLINKAIFNGWSGLFSVPVDNDDQDGDTLSFLDHPHVFDMEHLQEYAENHVDSQDRSDQNNTMIYNCLRATLSDKALDKVDKRSDEFIVNEVPSAICFLKVIIQASCLDTNKSATAARKTLMKLDQLIVKVHCRIFEDNSGAIEIAKVKKIRPRTKHINCKHFFFRSFVDSKQMTIHPVSTELQHADYLTKVLDYKLLSRHRKAIQGW